VSHAVEAGSPAECHSSYYVEGANEKSNAELEAVIFALDEYTPEGENTATEALEF
jgi:hypothetical protein